MAKLVLPSTGLCQIRSDCWKLYAGPLRDSTVTLWSLSCTRMRITSMPSGVPPGSVQLMVGVRPEPLTVIDCTKGMAPAPPTAGDCTTSVLPAE
jgi:hypothetical protein